MASSWEASMVAEYDESGVIVSRLFWRRIEEEAGMRLTGF